MTPSPPQTEPMTPYDGQAEQMPINPYAPEAGR
jgi:hypothetical protein